MNTTDNRLSIRSTLERVMAYADSGTNGTTNKPLVIRTDSIVTSDILRDAAVQLIKNSKKVTIGTNAIIDDGLNIVYNYDSSMVDESIELLKGKKYFIIVDWDFEPSEETLARMDFIDCVNEEAMTVSTLYSELKNLPEDLYIFAREDFSEGLLPIEVNQVTAGTVGYSDVVMKLRRVRQMLDELEPVSTSDRAVIYENDFFVGIEDYDPESDYAIIEMVSREKCVDKLVNLFRH